MVIRITRGKWSVRFVTAVLTVASLGVTLNFASGLAAAADIVQFGTFHFRSLITPNTLGVLSGDTLTLGGDFTPNPRTGDGATTVKASQGTAPCTCGTVACPAVLNVPYLDSPALPNEYATILPYCPDLAGSWTLTVQNPGSSNSPFVTSTPSVGNATNPGFIRGFSLTGAGPTPTFNWILPDLSHNSQTLFISERLPSGQPTIIHIVGLAPEATTYMVPTTLSGGGTLVEGKHYWVSINLNYTRADGSLLSRSRSIFEFLVQTSAPTNPIFLPFTAPDGVFRFDIPGVGNQMIFIDPPVAIGFDYAIGPGDPNFASVLLPDVGDGVYDVIANGAHSTVLAGQQFFFPQGGVAAFSVRGIDMSAGLDPLNVQAFVTGLTFVESGHFTGTMTPIVVPAIGDTCQCVSTWKNHGAYVSCVAKATDALVADGLLSETEQDVIVSDAAQSGCGRRN